MFSPWASSSDGWSPFGQAVSATAGSAGSQYPSHLKQQQKQPPDLTPKLRKKSSDDKKIKEQDSEGSVKGEDGDSGAMEGKEMGEKEKKKREYKLRAM